MFKIIPTDQSNFSGVEMHTLESIVKFAEQFNMEGNVLEMVNYVDEPTRINGTWGWDDYRHYQYIGCVYKGKFYDIEEMPMQETVKVVQMQKLTLQGKEHGTPWGWPRDYGQGARRTIKRGLIRGARRMSKKLLNEALDG